MIIKPRGVPVSLQIRRYLKPRMAFTDADSYQMGIDEKGYAGECLFDSLIAKSPAATYLQLNDLLLERRSSTIQIDSLLIAPHKIYLNDVKNFEGEYVIEGDQWFRLSGAEAKNPLLQLQRCESLLRPLIQSMGINLPIESKVIFVNPEFTLFQANSQLPIILPTQVNSFMKKFASVSMKPNKNLIEFAKKLAALDVVDSQYRKTHIPEYSYESLKKGMPCCQCGSLLTHLCGRDLVCEVCHHKEPLHDGVVRCVEEHKLLFPKRLITVAGMIEWCGGGMDRKRMHRFLKDLLVMVGNKRNAYYQ